MSIDSLALTSPVLRGSPRRITDLMEAFQVGYVRTIAAAAGVVIGGAPEIDEGIDMILTHRSAAHTRDAARLEVQLKATRRRPTAEGLSAKLTADRYNYLRDPDPSVGKLLIVMSVPKEQDRWVHASANRLKVRHAAYWVNLAGEPAPSGESRMVTAPAHQIFDDIALCAIMARIGQGGAP